MRILSFLIISIALFNSCGQLSKESNKEATLPILGRNSLVERIENGKVNYDTVPHTIRDFAFVNQDSDTVSNSTFDGKVYVADFFFTSCPTICPVMKKQMLRVYEEYKDNPKVGILSHTIDPEYDTVALLKNYAERLGVTSNTWHFVTGDKETIYKLSESSYMVTAGEDDTAPGGFIHSGAFLLVDDLRRVRGVYDGTEQDQVDILIADIEKLLAEMKIRNGEIN
jgi:protein SCO1/2